MPSLPDTALSALIPLLILLHLYVAPYTKVEESFNIQAIHDIVTYGVPTENASDYFKTFYDHVEFPGSVPRTFVGAAVLAGLSRPFVGLLSSPEQLQLLVRAILGLLNAFALVYFRGAVDTAYGKVAGRWYLLFQASQFHVIFYASRTLPNMLVFPLTTIALRNMILVKSVPARTARSTQRRRLALYLLTFAGVVFRSEIAVLLAAETAFLLLNRQASLAKEIIPAGIFGAVIGLLTTVTVDSFFWQEFPLWPEWSGFYYNLVQGKASEWGTSPASYYFFNSIPKLLLNPMLQIVCIPLAIIITPLSETSRGILSPLLLFVCIYSVLPHKEWRFIIYIIPSLTAIASGGAAWIWNRRAKSLIYFLLSLSLFYSLIFSFAASFGLLYISSLNYPGGEALTRLHALANETHGTVNVHMGNLACQTGVTRFLQLQQPNELSAQAGDVLWRYDKTEDEQKMLDATFWAQFDYVLAEEPERVIGYWEPVDVVEGFDGVQLTLKQSSQGAGTQDAKEQIDDAQSLPGVHGRPAKIYAGLVRYLRGKFTRGYWPAVKMRPRIYILRRGSENAQST